MTDAEIDAGCLDGPHALPAGPNEDVAQCSRCGAPIGILRAEGEQYGLHADDCSLPRRHRGECVGGGNGHPVPEIVRGYWPGMDADVAAARERFGSVIPSAMSPFGPLDKQGHDGHAPQLNGLLADCPGCATSPGMGAS